MSDKITIDGDIPSPENQEEEKLDREVREKVKNTTLKLMERIVNFIDKYDSLVQDSILKSKLKELVEQSGSRKITKESLIMKVLYARALKIALGEFGFGEGIGVPLTIYSKAIDIINLDYVDDAIIEVIKRVLNFNPIEANKDIELKRAYFEGFK